MPTDNPIPSSDPSDLLFNAPRFDEFMNGEGDHFSDRKGRQRSTLSSLERDFPSSQDNMQRALEYAEHADSARDVATSAADVAVLARDASIAAAGPLYATEAAGRAAVGDNETFNVQGAGDVAAYQYRRINAGVSVLIAEYPSAGAVLKLREIIETTESDDDVAVSIVFGDDSRTWLEAGRDGRPTAHAAGVLGDVVGVKPISASEDTAAVLLSESGQLFAGWRRTGEPVFAGPVPYTPTGFTAFGDSTTFGDGLTSTQSERWTTLLGARIGVHIENRGVNGAKSGDIASRYGALAPVMSVSGGIVPASGSVTLNAIDLNPTRGAPAFPVELLCEGGERIAGTMLPVNFASATFTRYTAGAAVNTTRARVISRMSDQSRRRVLFCGMGVNDEADIVAGTVKTSAIKSFYRSISIVQAAAKTRIVVWGMLDRGQGEAPGTPIGNYIVEIEQFLLEEFGASFAPVRQFLSSAYGLTMAARLQPSFVPTTADNDAVAAGVTPPSYRVGGTSVHLNPLGHQLQAWFFHQHLITRGLA